MWQRGHAAASFLINYPSATDKKGGRAKLCVRKNLAPTKKCSLQQFEKFISRRVAPHHFFPRLWNILGQFILVFQSALDTRTHSSFPLNFME
jgi:hypothetical protein